MANSQSEENYLKAIFTLESDSDKSVSTTSIAKRLSTKASSVTDMVKKLADKKFVSYMKYQGVRLTPTGRKVAINIIRKHRLWEVFLLRHLNFKWDEVHNIAEQLEHIESNELTDRLDQFLGNPKFDPHGDPIPDAKGKIVLKEEALILAEMPVGSAGSIVGVKDSSSPFLRYLESRNLIIGTKIRVQEVFDFDGSMTIVANKTDTLSVSKEVCNNLVVEKK